MIEENAVKQSNFCPFAMSFILEWRSKLFDAESIAAKFLVCDFSSASCDEAFCRIKEAAGSAGDDDPVEQCRVLL
jgi:hypothetical protein